VTALATFELVDLSNQARQLANNTQGAITAGAEFGLILLAIGAATVLAGSIVGLATTQQA
jgi:hypothetical protein